MRPPWVLAIACAAAVSGAAAAQWQLEVVLSGANVVPPVATSATGVGVFTLNQASNVVSYFLIATPMAAPTATVRLGFAGQNGPSSSRWAEARRPGKDSSGRFLPSDVITLLKQGMYARSAPRPFRTARSGSDPADQEEQLLRDDRRRAGRSPDREPGKRPTSTRLNEPDGVLVYEVTASGIANGSTATARLGAPGQNGPASSRSSERAGIGAASRRSSRRPSSRP